MTFRLCKVGGCASSDKPIRACDNCKFKLSGPYKAIDIQGHPDEDSQWWVVDTSTKQWDKVGEDRYGHEEAETAARELNAAYEAGLRDCRDASIGVTAVRARAERAEAKVIELQRERCAWMDLINRTEKALGMTSFATLPDAGSVVERAEEVMSDVRALRMLLDATKAQRSKDHVYPRDRHCANCGHPAGSQYCHECFAAGESVPRHWSSEHTCHNCGNYKAGGFCGPHDGLMACGVGMEACGIRDRWIPKGEQK